ncbi:hypothetical protein, partial [Neisseria iguanae]|uniref:hypothetical protein n=1 Tax=Neisseria iguanae TaxID=90242 RepID=UPI001B80C1D2
RTAANDIMVQKLGGTGSGRVRVKQPHKIPGSNHQWQTTLAFLTALFAGRVAVSLFSIQTS